MLLAIFANTNYANAQQFLRVEGTRIVNEKSENIILRGMGLGGWMLQEGYMLGIHKEGQQNKIRSGIQSLVGAEKTQEFYDAWLNNHTTRKDVEALKAWGFNSVRLPMHYNLYTLPVQQEPVAGQHTWLQKGFDLTDSLLAWCKENDLYLILDLHAAPGGQGSDLNIADGDTTLPNLWQSEANQQKTIALWQKLAARYANEPAIGGYDIINEPNWGFEDPINDKNGLQEKLNVPLKKLMEDITAAIRQVDKKHIIIIEGNGWGNNYNGILPPWDKNMVLSFHKYWNYNDLNSIQHILDFRNKYNVPVWLGETGENSNTWFTEAIHLLENNNIGWAWWPLKKIGSNNPLEIVSNPDYDAVIKYLNDKTTQPPSAERAYKGLMQLAENLKMEKNIYHHDVTDAMLRQPFANTALPYKKHSVANSYSLAAVDYDLGKNGVAYYDMDTANYRISTGKASSGNRGRVYRNDGVDIYKDVERSGDYYVGQTETGEWLQYTIDVHTAGNYEISFVSAGDAEGSVKVSLNGSILTNDLLLPATGNKLGWKATHLKNIQLKKGSNSLRIAIVKGGFNLKSVEFLKVGK